LRPLAQVRRAWRQSASTWRIEVALFGSALQYVVVRCSVFQVRPLAPFRRAWRQLAFTCYVEFAVCRGVLQCIVMRCSVLQSGSVCCRVWPCVAVCLQSVWVFVSVVSLLFSVDVVSLAKLAGPTHIVWGMRWLRLVGSLKSQVSFSEYRLFDRSFL